MDGLESFIGRLDIYDGAAAWLHTLASILGLGIAIYLPLAQSRTTSRSGSSSPSAAITGMWRSIRSPLAFSR